MHLETGNSELRPAHDAAVLANRERQICEAAELGKAAFAELTSAVNFEADTRGSKARVFRVFRWYFLSAYCTRMLSDATHRLEHHTLQVSMDVFSAVRMSLSDSEVEVSMALVGEDVTTPAAAYSNKVGRRGHSAGWIAAKLQEQGREIPAEIKNSLTGALSASVPRI
ncbi:hypothetical protein [Ruegeria sp. Ofav3-42]|uniref:hypothetical protein n=1 Tax=Ruegeria sp. Ofav3-42 TaxID=2917759 RepID=UPI001EF691E1|nr:hypothetical protein [Ruegeria sp. Ofav3-42]MCG7520884.1 hypothetical protein [Ruegeria sp. Ofav3-42]